MSCGTDSICFLGWWFCWLCVVWSSLVHASEWVNRSADGKHVDKTCLLMSDPLLSRRASFWQMDSEPRLFLFWCPRARHPLVPLKALVCSQLKKKSWYLSLILFYPSPQPNRQSKWWPRVCFCNPQICWNFTFLCFIFSLVFWQSVLMIWLGVGTKNISAQDLEKRFELWFTC